MRVETYKWGKQALLIVIAKRNTVGPNFYQLVISAVQKINFLFTGNFNVSQLPFLPNWSETVKLLKVCAKRNSKKFLI